MYTDTGAMPLVKSRVRPTHLVGRMTSISGNTAWQAGWMGEWESHPLRIAVAVKHPYLRRACNTWAYTLFVWSVALKLDL